MSRGFWRHSRADSTAQCGPTGHESSLAEDGGCPVRRRAYRASLLQPLYRLGVAHGQEFDGDANMVVTVCGRTAHAADVAVVSGAAQICAHMPERCRWRERKPTAMGAITHDSRFDRRSHE